MPFIKYKNFPGKLYVPDKTTKKQKHPCKDCYNCIFCDDKKCELCLKQQDCCKQNTSQAPDNK